MLNSQESHYNQNTNLTYFAIIDFHTTTITNNQSLIKSISGNTTLIATNDINNIGSTIRANNQLKLIASNNIRNTTTISTNDQNLVNSDNVAYVANPNLAFSTTNIQSAINSIASLEAGEVNIMLGNNFTNQAAKITTTKNTIDPTIVGGVATTSSGDVAIIAGGDISITSLILHDHSEVSWGNKKKGGSTTIDKVENISSNLNSEGDINLIANNNTIIQASKLNADDQVNIDSGNGTYLLAATDSYYEKTQTHNKKTFTFKNNDRGSFDTNIINTQITSGASGTDNININSANQNYVQYGREDKNNLNYLSNLNQETTLLDPIDEIHKNWDKTNRGLTSTGMIAVAIVATVATAGAATVAATAASAAAVSAGAAAGGAMATGAGLATATAVGATAATASVSATNASMNADGNVLQQATSITRTTFRETTSEESLKNIAISSAAAGLTAGVGVATGLTTTVSTTATFSTQLQNALANQVLSSTVSSAIQSSVNGDSFTDNLNNQAKNIIINTIGQIAANQIGELAHPDPNNNPNALTNPITGEMTTTPKINTVTQLALHAGLGCAMGAASNGNCGAGVAGAVAGEVVGSALRDSVYGTNTTSSTISKETAVQIAGLSGAAAGLTASIVMGQDDAKTANGVWAGYNEGGNAAENNALYLGGKIKVWKSDLITGKGNDYDLHAGAQGQLLFTEFSAGSDGIGKAGSIIPQVGAGIYFNAIPHNQEVQTTISYGWKNGASFDILRTYQNNTGLGASFGISTPPLLPVNITVDIPDKQKPNK